MRNIIEIENVTKHYGAFAALSEIDLAIGEGEVVCVIGPSGSGKSTLIRCINLLESYSDKGSIRVDGIPVQPGPTLGQVRAEVGMVFQSFNLFPHMSVLKNVMLAPMRVRRTPAAEAAAKARELLARVGIAEPGIGTRAGACIFADAANCADTAACLSAAADILCVNGQRARAGEDCCEGHLTEGHVSLLFHLLRALCASQ